MEGMLIVSKNRYGFTGTLDARWNKDTGKQEGSGC